MRFASAIASAAAFAIIGVFSALAETQPPALAAVEIAKAAESATPEGILGEPYLLTWEKDPRMRGREPFSTVLHYTGEQTSMVRKFDLPRTPSEEAAFVMKAQSYVEEAAAALEAGDFKAAEGKIDTAIRMTEVTLVTKTARDKMASVAVALVDVEKVMASGRARAALKEALEIAARMQAYFDNDRHGEVISLQSDLDGLNTSRGLKNPEVLKTAAALLAKTAELARRAQLHLDFNNLELSVDAVSHFPEGKSFAIINGEVFGEGGTVAPELTMASVAVKKVVFDFRGESIALDLTE